MMIFVSIRHRRRAPVGGMLRAVAVFLLVALASIAADAIL